ncbi:hypothetical protein NC652_025669 [Populus alba x Populus x berolinensis]|nr:hypothetical protein NC652_025669 [Populus alba x Populus x berolinensis]
MATALPKQHLTVENRPKNLTCTPSGFLLLEILTGKCPSIVDCGATLPRWVQSVVREEWTAEVFDLELMRYKDIEEEMVGLLSNCIGVYNSIS